MCCGQTTKKKATAFYISFLEFNLLLRQERFWLPVAFLRHSIVAKVPGGLSEASLLLFRTMFSGEMNLRSGFQIEAAGSLHAITAKLHNVLGDESAIKQFWSCKGSAGIKPCFLCKNVITKHGELANHVDSTYFVTIACSDSSKFDPMSDNDVYQMVDHLKSQFPLVSTATFDDLQKSVGLSFSPTGVLADVSIREHVSPISSTTFDYMHCYLSSGALPLETHAFLKEVKHIAGVGYPEIYNFIKEGNWKQPRFAVKLPTYEVFSSVRDKSSGDSMKAMASELLAVLPFVRQFGEVVAASAAPKLDAHITCFRLMHDIIKYIESLKKLDYITDAQCEKLRNLQSQHSHCFVQVYTDDLVKPKHHYCRHLPTQFRRDRMVLDTFVHERKHKQFKACASNHDSLKSLERTVLSSCVTAQKEDLVRAAAVAPVSLIGKVVPWPEFATLLSTQIVSASRGLNFHHTRFWVGDVVWVGEQVATITMCLLIDTAPCVLVKFWQPIEPLFYSSRWSPLPETRLLQLTQINIILAKYWSFDEDGDLILLD